MKKILKENYLELYVFLLDYYDGVFSRGYRILCRLKKYTKITDNCIAECRKSEIYLYLENKYIDKI